LGGVAAWLKISLASIIPLAKSRFKSLVVCCLNAQTWARANKDECGLTEEEKGWLRPSSSLWIGLLFNLQT
jgi:hypothetical protein